jgi:hypothetical protein
MAHRMPVTSFSVPLQLPPFLKVVDTYAMVPPYHLSRYDTVSAKTKQKYSRTTCLPKKWQGLGAEDRLSAITHGAYRR